MPVTVKSKHVLAPSTAEPARLMPRVADGVDEVLVGGAIELLLGGGGGGTIELGAELPLDASAT